MESQARIIVVNSILICFLVFLVPSGMCAPAREDIDDNIRTIVIDPGHGGDDSGSVGVYGQKEKDVALRIAQELRDQITSYLGYRIILTRDGDYQVPLKRRIEIANNVRSALFISIHASGSFAQSGSGFRVIYTEYSEAERGIYAVMTGGKTGRLWDLLQLKYLDNSKVLADKIHQSLAQMVFGTDAGMIALPIEFLKHIDMPAIMIEVGNLSNPEDEIRFGNNEYISGFARAILKGIEAYLGEGPEEQIR